MEVTIANRRWTSFGLGDSKDEAKFSSRITPNEAMYVFEAELVRIMGKLRWEDKRRAPFKDANKEASHAKRAPGEEISIP